MREELVPLEGGRHAFRGTVVAQGDLNGFLGKVLLYDVSLSETGRYLCDHVWMSMDGRITDLGVSVEERIEFTAEVYRYSRPNGLSDLSLRDPQEVRRAVRR